MTPNPVFKVTTFFDAEYPRNGARYRHSYNELLIGTYALLKSVISNDLERLSEIFNDTKHRAVSATATAELLVLFVLVNRAAASTAVATQGLEVSSQSHSVNGIPTLLMHHYTLNRVVHFSSRSAML